MRAPTDTGAEIWQHSLLGAITLEAEAIAELTEAPAGSHGTRQRRRLRDRIVAEMTETLTTVGDRYTAPDGVRYSLVDDKGAAGVDTLRGVTAHDPVVTDVIEFQTLPAGTGPIRAAIVRWSDGTESTALAWFADEILSPVNNVGRQ